METKNTEKEITKEVNKDVADTRTRKWMLTINNPVQHGFPHDRIKEELKKLKSVIYWCMADEIGNETKTYHTHIFIAACNAIRFSTLKKRFPTASLEMCNGTCQQCKDYVRKEGKWEGKSKQDTRVDGTFEEWGEMPVERQGKRNDMDDLFDMINAGMDNYDIVHEDTRYMTMLTDIERVRQTIREKEFRNTFRELETTYIYGATGTGKTRGVMEKYGYPNCYRVTDYVHPFDNYAGQDVIIFEEFRSSLRLADMLNYLDGYPVELPCRYTNKIACFTKVYIITNIELHDQYPETQKECKESWAALMRRIHNITRYKADGTSDTLLLSDYLKGGFDDFVDVSGDADLPVMP